MKKILHLTIFLAVVAAVAGGALAFANDLTTPIIEKNQLAAEKESLKILYPEASDFKSVALKGDSKTIQKIFQVDDTTYIFKMQVAGYKDGTVFMVAINTEGDLLKYHAISNGDTSGIGTKVTEAAFKASLEGKKANEPLDTISGATVSSKPVVEGIHEAAAYVDEYLK